MFRQAERSIQLDFRCRSCGLAGLTPEVTQQEAVLLTRDQLSIRCPKCGDILTIRAHTLELLAKNRGVTSFGQEVRELMEQALRQELERRNSE